MSVSTLAAEQTVFFLTFGPLPTLCSYQGCSHLPCLSDLCTEIESFPRADSMPQISSSPP